MARPVHSTLLADEIPIVEHLTGLELLPAGGSVSSPFRSRSRGWVRSRCERSASWREAERHATLRYRTLGFVETHRYWDNPIDRTIYLEKTIGSVDRPSNLAESADEPVGVQERREVGE